ncbi:MAG: phage holin family protein [Myxococcota bacterium]
MRLLLRWLVMAIALGVTAYLLPGIRVEDPTALVVGSAVLGLVNATVRPVLKVLTFPITILTLGIFLLVVNGLSFMLAAWFVSGFEVNGLGWAMLGAVGVSIVSWMLSGIGDDDDDDD